MTAHTGQDRFCLPVPNLVSKCCCSKLCKTEKPCVYLNLRAGGGVCAMEPNVWSVSVREAWDASGIAAAEPRSCGVLTWDQLQPWEMPILLPLSKFSFGEGCSSPEEGLPRLGAGLGGLPWDRDSGRVQGKPGSCSPAFCPESQKAEALVGEEAQAEGPPCRLMLQQPPSLLDPQPGASEQEAQTSDQEPLGQGDLPAASSWWRRGSLVFSGLLERSCCCPAFSFRPACCPSAPGTRQP